MSWVRAAALGPIAGTLLLGVRAPTLAGRAATTGRVTGRPPATVPKESRIVFGGSQ